MYTDARITLVATSDLFYDAEEENVAKIQRSLRYIIGFRRILQCAHTPVPTPPSAELSCTSARWHVWIGPVTTSKACDLREAVVSPPNFQRKKETDGAENTLQCDPRSMKFDRITVTISATDGKIKALDTHTHTRAKHTHTHLFLSNIWKEKKIPCAST